MMTECAASIILTLHIAGTSLRTTTTRSESQCSIGRVSLTPLLAIYMTYLRITNASDPTSDQICTDCDKSSVTSETLCAMTYTASVATSKVYWLPFTPCVRISPFGQPQDLP